MAAGNPPAGWYDDPTIGAGHRWWDGERWTDHIRPLAAPPTTPAMSNEPPSDWPAGPDDPGLVESGESAPPRPWLKRTWVRVTAGVVGLLAVVGALGQDPSTSETDAGLQTFAAVSDGDRDAEPTSSLTSTSTTATTASSSSTSLTTTSTSTSALAEESTTAPTAAVESSSTAPPSTQPPTTAAPTTTPPTTTPQTTPPPTTPPPTTVASTTASTSSGCDPNYSGGCVPIASDVDCEGGGGNGPAYVRGPVTVIGSDIYGLDRDNDGIGCEVD